MRAPPGQLGPFQIREPIRQSLGLGVYTAIDTRTKQTVVLYVLDLHTQQPSTSISHLQQAAQRINQINHEHIVAFSESEEQDHYRYMATVPLAGATLASHLQQRKTPVPLQEATTLIQQVAAGLDAAHQQQCWHLGLTPSEIWITSDGKAQVLGLGVPRPARMAATQPADLHGALSPYTAPEQVQQDAPVDQRVDVYSLGAIAYTLLGGQPPLQAADPAQLAAEIVHRTPEPLDQLQPELPARINLVFRFVLAKDPELRYASAGELAAALVEAQQWEASAADVHQAAPSVHIRRLPNRRLTGVLLLLPLIVLAGVWLVWRSFQPARQVTMDSLAAVAESASAQHDQPAENPILGQPTTGDVRTLAITPTIAAASSEIVTATTVETATMAVTVTDEPPATTPDRVPADLPASVPVTLTAGVTATGVTDAIPEPSPTPIVPTATSTTAPQSTATATPRPTATSTPQPSSSPTPTRSQTTTATRRAAQLPAEVSPTANNRPTLPPSSTDSVRATTATVPAHLSTRVVTETASILPSVTPRAAATAMTTTTPAPLLRSQAQEFTLYFPLIKYQLALQARVIRNANLRAGPDVSFPVIGNSRSGETITLVACNPACTWYQLANGAWIASFLVESASDPSQLLPQPAPTPGDE